MYTIALIGCGSTGVGFLAQLLEGLVVAPNSLKVLIFEKSDVIGPGLAYSCHKELLMNSSASIVTVIDGDNFHFLRWLASSREKWEPHYPAFAHLKEFDPDWFAPRALVGIYLSDMFEKYHQEAIQKGVIVEVIKDEVVDIVEQYNGTSVVTATGNNYVANSVVISTGNICASPNYSHLANIPSFYPSQYVNIDYSTLKGKRVLVLGTSLGAVDTALLLHSADPKPNVVLASKRGRLPAVKGELKEYTYTKLNHSEVDALRLEKGRFGVHEVDTLVKRELLESVPDLASSNFFDLPVKDDPVALFEREIELLQDGEALWQRFQFGWINVADYLWKNMETEVDKRKFQNYYTNNIHRFTSSFHIDIALKIRTWLRNGTLNLASIPDPASLKHNAESDEFSARIALRDGDVEEQRFDVVIDASGVSKKFVESAPLFRNLHQNDLATFNPYGGLDMDEDTLRVRGTDKLSARVYAAGTPTYGSFFYTNFIIVGARHTAIIAREIRQELKSW